MKRCKTYIVYALFSLLAVSQASAQSIVGAWTIGDATAEGAAVTVFRANGTFYHIENALASEAPHGFDGFERGTYTWDSVTGAFTSATLQDLNGDIGFSNLNGLSGVTVSVSGDTLTVSGVPGGESPTFTRVRGASPIVGAWRQGNWATADNSGVVVFLPNGVYFEATDTSTGEPGYLDGIEHGTYAWNPTTGVLTSSRTPPPYVDTDGQSGLSDADGSGLTFTLQVSADGLTLTGTIAADSFSLERVGGVASAPTTTDVVEYFNAGFGHYFTTADADEIAGLDAGAYNFAFLRTSSGFKAWNGPKAGIEPVCRFFTTPGTFGTKSSHFYTANPVECQGLKSNPNWIYEKIAFYVAVPTAEVCGAGTVPIYRMYNNGQTAAPNHRFTTSLALYQQFTSSMNWSAEGIAFCGQP